MPTVKMKKDKTTLSPWLASNRLHLSNFNKLWIGETVSYFGVQITNVAFPLTAVVILHATSREIGILNALTFLPFLLFTLFIGIYVDRRTKRPILLFANIGRACLLLVLPIAYWTGLLTIEMMDIITFCIGILTVAFDASFQTYIPALIPKEQLVAANSKFISSSSTAMVAGPGLGGYLIQFIGSVCSILINVITYLFSAFCIWKINKNENMPEIHQDKFNMKQDILEGLSFILKNPYIRPIVLEAATYNFFDQILITIILIYAKVDLHLSAGVIGLFFSFAGVGAIIGSLATEKVVNLIGIGPATIVSMIVACTGPLLIPFTNGSTTMVSIFIMTGFFINGIGLGLSNVTCTTLRQTIIPPELLARALSSSRLLTWGIIPLGALIGGLLGDYIGLHKTLEFGVIGLSISPIWVILSRLRELKVVNAQHIKKKA